MRLLCSTSTVFNFVGFVINSFVIYLVTHYNVIPGKIPKAFLFNQLFSDWLTCLFRSFAWATDRDWNLPDNLGSTAFCHLFWAGFLYWGIAHASFTNLVLLNLERYISVVHPQHHKKLTAPVIGILIFLSWSTGFVRISTVIAETARDGNHCIQLYPTEFWVDFISALTCAMSFGLPIVVIIYCNSRMLWTLASQEKKMHISTAAANPAAAHRNRVQRELAYSVCILGVVFIITNAPVSFAYTLNVYGVIVVDYVSWYYEIFIFMNNCFFIANPLACLFQLRSLRSQAAHLLYCACRPRRHADGPYVVSVGAFTSDRNSSAHAPHDFS